MAALAFGGYTLGMLPSSLLISFPKCGRTWVRTMISIVLKEVQKAGYPVPPFAVSHDDDPHWKRPDELERDKRKYTRNRVIFMVRDPRDVIVSLFFERTRRISLYNPINYEPQVRDRVKAFSGTISGFLRERTGSLATLLEFLNLWARSRSIPERFVLIKYEDVHLNPAGELKRALEEGLGISVPDSLLEHAAQSSSFDKMRAVESSQKMDHPGLRPADPADPESYKTRRGKVGGFVDYLGEEDIRYIDELMRRELDPWYGYAQSL